MTEKQVGAVAGSFVPAVVVPTFNHGRTLPGVLTGLAALGIPIVVVDDGSTDGTREVVERWGAEHPGVRMVLRVHARNRGKGAALRTGFEAAMELGATHAVSMDADGQLDPKDVPAMLEAAEERPRTLVLGVRPEVIPNRPERCSVGRRFTSLAVRGQTGLRIADTQCGLRVYPLAMVREVRCAGGRYAFEAEIITRAAWAGYGVAEVPVGCVYFVGEDRVSHFRPWRDSLRQAGLHVRLTLRALVPLGIRSAPVAGAAAVPERPLWRRGIDWINPVRCVREARGNDLGRLELALALGMGAMIGSSPFFGFHGAISVYVAWRLHLHPAAVVLGSQVSVPPVGVALAAASVWIGHLVLTGSVLRFADLGPDWASLPWFAMHWLPAWMIGSVFVGLAVGLSVFGLVLLVSGRRGRVAGAG